MNVMEKMTKDEVFEVLSSSRRRLILYHLHRRGGEAELRDLAGDTAEAEKEGDIDDDVVKRFYISLYQTHVPRLKEVGLVQHDSDNNVVSLTDNIEEIEGVLGSESEPERRWWTYYGVLALLGSVLAGAQVVGALPPEASVVFAVVLLLLAVFQYYETEFKENEYSFIRDLIDE